MPLPEQQGQSGTSGAEEVIDLRLVTLAVDGDRAAFDELFRRHATLARRVAWSVLHDDADADDVVADAFERLLRAVPADRLHDRRAFRAYLLVTTRNLALNAARQRARLPRTGHDALLDLTNDASPLDDVVDDEETALLRRAFAALPERWRSVLWLTEIEGLGHREAAELLGTTANGVAQLASRARAGLRETFLQAHVTGKVPDECRFTRERLAAHLAGALPAAEAARVDDHLERCPACREHFVGLGELAGSLRHAAIPIAAVLGAGLTRGSMELLRPTRIAFRVAQGVAVAAAIGGLVLGGLLHLREPAPPVQPVVTVQPVLSRPATTVAVTTRTTTIAANPAVAPPAPPAAPEEQHEPDPLRRRGVGPAPACHPKVARPHGGGVC